MREGIRASVGLRKIMRPRPHACKTRPRMLKQEVAPGNRDSPGQLTPYFITLDVFHANILFPPEFVFGSMIIVVTIVKSRSSDKFLPGSVVGINLG